MAYTLPGGIVYQLDFAVKYADGHCRWFEVKGYATPEWKIKQKLMKDAHPHVTIEVVK